MKQIRTIAWSTLAALLITGIVLVGLGQNSTTATQPALAAKTAAPTISGSDPAAAPNDLDTPIVITGDNFENGITATLGSTALQNLTWISATRLTATIPWGMSPGVYTLTVRNPGGETAHLPDGFTVTPALGVWNSATFYGGNVNTVRVNPQDPNTVYAAAFDTGLFRSRDGGATWTYIWAGMAERLAIDPLAPTRLYMNNLRSEDEGETWTWMAAPWGPPYPHPAIADRVYIISSDTNGDTGIWRSNDHGETWNTAMNGLTDTLVTVLAFDPVAPETLYAGTTNGNLFKSLDGGDQWTFVTQLMSQMASLAVNPRGAHEVWVSNHQFAGTPLTYKSTDAALTTWIPVDTGNDNRENIIFAPLGWSDAYSQTLYVGTSRSLDGGATWENISPTNDGDNFHSMALHPTNPNVAYFSSDRVGVYQTTDGATAWQVANQGLAALVPSELVATPGYPEIVYAVTERGLYKSGNGGQVWDLLNRDLDNTVAVDPTNPLHLYTSSGSSYGWELWSSLDGGLSWSTTAILTNTAPYDDYSAALFQKIHFQPGQPSTMLASVSLLRFGTAFLNAGIFYWSTDSGLTWERATVDGGAGVDSHIRDLAYDTLTPTIAYAATESSGLYRTADGGITWQRTGQALPALDHGDAVAVEPIAPYRVFVATYDGLYVSADHGLTWQQAPAPLRSVSVTRLAFTTSTPPVLYAATRNGLYRSYDNVTVWQRATGALGLVPVPALAVGQAGERSLIYAGTSGGDLGGAVLALSRAMQVADDSLVAAGVYRYADLGSTLAPLPAWEQVNVNGFGSADNSMIAALEPFGGALYAATWGTAQVWRTIDGTSWAHIATTWPISNVDVTDMVEHNGRLYVGTYNDAGGELWRTDGVTWEQVVTGGFGETANVELKNLAVFSHTLYVATDNSTGAPQVWRSTSGDAGSWSKVADTLGGYGVMHVYNHEFYLGMGGGDGAELWRTGDGLTWTPVFTDGLGQENPYVASIAEFDGYLYIGMANGSTGGQLWRSSNGQQWTPVFTNGLGNPDNIRLYGLIASSEHLYAVFSNLITGAEVWRMAANGVWTPVVLGGWGDGANGFADYFNKGAALFNFDLYIAAFNDAGGEIWRLPLARHIYLPLTLKTYTP